MYWLIIYRKKKEDIQIETGKIDFSTYKLFLIYEIVFKKRGLAIDNNLILT